jgi:integrase
MEARASRQRAKDMLRQNIEPSLQRKAERQMAQFKYANDFKSVAEAWFQTNESEWTPRHATKLWRMLEIHVLPYLGVQPVAEIKARPLLEVLKKIEGKGATETAHRALWACSRIFKYAVVLGIAESNPAINIGDALKPNRGGNYPTIGLKELPAFLRRLEQVKAREQDKLAVRLLLLTALRTGELRRCRWSDVDFANAEIRVPKEIMKMREAHIVPLSRQAIDALLQLFRLSGHQEWLLPNQGWGRHPIMSENVVNNLIAEAGYKGRMVGHSFRKLFSTVLNEEEFHEGAIDRQLAHRKRSKAVQAIYNHAQYLKTRRLLMQWWADYLDSALRQSMTENSATARSGFATPWDPMRSSRGIRACRSIAINPEAKQAL